MSSIVSHLPLAEGSPRDRRCLSPCRRRGGRTNTSRCRNVPLLMSPPSAPTAIISSSGPLIHSPLDSGTSQRYFLLLRFQMIVASRQEMYAGVKHGTLSDVRKEKKTNTPHNNKGIHGDSLWADVPQWVNTGMLLERTSQIHGFVLHESSFSGLKMSCPIHSPGRECCPTFIPDFRVSL